MKMHYTQLAPIGIDYNARGVSRWTGSGLSSAASTQGHSQVFSTMTSPQPFGRKRRF
ncbi:MAG: hypothetical protein M3Y13_07805 [Armatimonadota bacterium]|nr:hypothetical protein [Armatimonadota bacterium]